MSSFPTMFSTQSDNCIPVCPFFDIISLFAAELEEHKSGISGKGLKSKRLINKLPDILLISPRNAECSF